MELNAEPEGVTPKWEDWLNKRKSRLEQLSAGNIEPVVAESEKDKYPKHIILKNTKNKMK